MHHIVALIFIGICVCSATIITNGPFELDGNAVSLTKDDWDTLVNGAGTAKSFSGIKTDPPPLSIFTTGGSKNTNDIPQWKNTNGSVPDKDQLLDAFAAIYVVDGKVYLYFGTDRRANDGDATIGFWFFKNTVAVNGNTFSGTHANGDLLILADFGSSTEAKIYKWENGGLVLLLSNANARCTQGATQSACYTFNTQTVPSPWNFVPKSGAAQNFPPTSFMEGGLLLNDFFNQDIPCYSSFLAVSRSSSSTSAVLKDFVLNEFNSCKLDVSIKCNGTEADPTQTFFITTYEISVKNDGFGILYNVVVSYNGLVVATVPQLPAGQTYTYTGQFNTAQTGSPTGTASVVAYTSSSLSETSKLTGTSGPAACDPLRIITGIEPTIACNDVYINETSEEYQYSFSGSISNIGFGAQTLQSVVVKYNGQQQNVALQGTVLNPVTPPTSVNFNGVIKTTQQISQISVTVVSKNYLNADSGYDTTAATCPPVNVNPAIYVNKTCHSSLELLNNKLVVNVDITMFVCNTGNIKLKTVSLGDYIENYDDIYFNTTNLDKNVCREFHHNYYPSVANAQLTFSDTFTAIAWAILNLGNATATVNATCGLCPNE